MSVSAKDWGGLGGNESVVVLIMDEEDEVDLIEMVLEGVNGVEIDDIELVEFNGVLMSSSSSSVRSMRMISCDGLMLSLGFLALCEVVAMVEDMVSFWLICDCEQCGCMMRA